MNILLLSPLDRIIEWRKLRKQLDKLDELEQLNKVVEFWSTVPIQTYSIDWDQPKNWPSPWELIYEGNLCQTSIAYLIEQTLIFAKWQPDRIKLSFIKDPINEEQLMIVVIDEKYALNYSQGEVFNFDKIRNKVVELVNYRYINNSHVETN